MNMLKDRLIYMEALAPFAEGDFRLGIAASRFYVERFSGDAYKRFCEEFNVNGTDYLITSQIVTATMVQFFATHPDDTSPFN